MRFCDLGCIGPVVWMCFGSSIMMGCMNCSVTNLLSPVELFQSLQL